MVAYFRKQNNLFMLLGGVLGLVLSILFFDQLTGSVPGYFRMFFVIFPVLVGVVVGRICAAFWANRKLREYNALLYEQVEPEKFLEKFTPLAEQAPKNSIAYVDGCVKLSYAYEALGRFEQAEELVASLKPEDLKNHALGGMAIASSQHIRVLLLQEKVDEAKDKLVELRNIAEAAVERAPTLGKNAQECVRLYENWLAVLEKQPVDEAYLEEEIQLSKNRIHKSEMQLLLARACENRGDVSQADELRLEVLGTGKGLWAEGEARLLLNTQ